MSTRLKHEVAWGIAEIIYQPLYLYLAILGIGRLEGAHGALPFAWKFLLIVILVMVNGMLYIWNCVRTFRSLKHEPQADLSKPAFVAYAVWVAVSSVLAINGFMQLPEVHPVLFLMFSGLASASLALFVAALLVRTCVHTFRAFVQGMREAK